MEERRGRRQSPTGQTTPWRTRSAGRRGHTDLDRNERNDDLLEALSMVAGDSLLEELEHVLEDLDARVEQVDPLRDLEVASRSFVEWLEVGVRRINAPRTLPGKRGARA